MKRRIKYNDQEVDATVVGFSPIQEPWNEYSLTDGTTLKLKCTVTEILRLDDMHHPNGDPMYVTHSTNIMTTPNVPDHLRKQP